ncbi:trigger factor [Immundisolibacter sp.]|uniref:trigger factor n=1 Tax=Immundisolibacter sp. TaxID=1934948 RepID=UPI000EED0C57|nr:trigger factor [Gammaproteobacteria bacterium]
MTIPLESTGGLQRRLTLTLPTAEIEQQVTTRLTQLARQTRVNGFRPGKAPLSVIRRQHGARVRDEVVGELLQGKFIEGLGEHQLRPAGNPSINAENTDDGEALTFSASFEVFPEIELADLSGVTVTVPTASVSDDDVEKMLDRMRRQRAEWPTVERAAATDDRVVIDFAGSIDGEAFEGGSAQEVPIVLGSGTLIGDFEEQLLGASAGDARTVSVTFPDDYPRENLAGKSAQFEVTVREVQEMQLPALDAELAKAFGIEDGDLDTLRTRLRERLEQELSGALRRRRKAAVMQMLAEQHQFDLPHSLVHQEAHNLAHQAQQRNPAVDPHGDMAPFEAEAERRVKLGLLLAEITQRENIKADPQQVRAEIERMAAGFDDKDMVVNWYYSQPERLQEIENMTLEEQLVDWALSKVQVTEETLTFDDAVAA